MRVRCTACQNELQAPDSAAGTIVKCPACDQKLRLPQAPPGPPPSQLPAPIRGHYSDLGGGSGPAAENQPEYATYSGSGENVPPPQKTCPACGERVDREEKYCPYCDEELRERRYKKQEKEKPLYDEAWMRSASDDLEIDDYILAIMFPFFFLCCGWIVLFFIMDKGPKAKKMLYVSGAAMIFYGLLYLAILAFK